MNIIFYFQSSLLQQENELKVSLSSDSYHASVLGLFLLDCISVMDTYMAQMYRK